ncbi:MAG: hypothetical protein ACXW07_00800 [Nitrososphaeraceae archaeon]
MKANGKKRRYYKKSIYFYKDIGMGKVIEENDGWKFLIQSKIIKNFRI